MLIMMCVCAEKGPWHGQSSLHRELQTQGPSDVLWQNFLMV